MDTYKLKKRRDMYNKCSTVAFGHCVTAFPMLIISSEAAQWMLIMGFVLGLVFERLAKNITTRIENSQNHQSGKP